MFFSIVIPTYNREKTISRAINSILHQSYADYEVIIIDDGSMDNTEGIVKTFNNPIIKYFKTENFGVAHARNYGITKANGNYIGFLDSDDMMEVNHLQVAYNFIQEKQYPEIVHLNFSWGAADKIITYKNSLPKHLPNDIFKKCSLHVNCVFIKNEIAKQNLFNESRPLMFAEDWDFFIKLAIRFPIHLLDKATSYLVDHDDRSMRNFDENKWVLKRDAIVQSLRDDAVIQNNYIKSVNTVEAHMNSLIAINLAVRKYKFKSIKYWFKALRLNKQEILTRRSAAIIKHLLLSW